MEVSPAQLEAAFAALRSEGWAISEQGKGVPPLPPPPPSDPSPGGLLVELRQLCLDSDMRKFGGPRIPDDVSKVERKVYSDKWALQVGGQNVVDCFHLEQL